QLPHVVSFDERHQRSSGHLVQRHQEAKRSPHVGVLLHRHEAGGIVRCRHVVEEAIRGQLEAPPRMHHDFVDRLLSRNFLHGLDSHRHRKHRAHFCFTDVQSHSLRSSCVPTSRPPEVVPVPYLLTCYSPFSQLPEPSCLASLPCHRPRVHAAPPSESSD